MKRWQIVALIAVNLAVLPVSFWAVSGSPKSRTTFDRLCSFPVPHLIVTALAVNLYLLPKKLKERRERRDATLPAETLP